MKCLNLWLFILAVFCLEAGGVAKAKKLKVDLSSALTDKQRKALSSGFSTFSQLSISLESDGEVILADLVNKSCTVKYDSWEEKYQITIIEEGANLTKISDFARYSKDCLTVFLTEAQKAKLSNADAIVAKLQVEQISAEQAGKIREWIIKQQSGVIQGLFSHMLGEMTLSDSLEVRIPLKPSRKGGSSGGT